MPEPLFDLASTAPSLVDAVPRTTPRRRGRPPLAPAVKARVALRKYAFAMVPLDRVQPDYDPVRGPSTGAAEHEADEELKASIAKDGVLHSLVVVRIGRSRSRFRLADGARRYKAAIELGLPEVPCRVYGALARATFELLRWDSQHDA